MKTYYWETERDDGEFQASSDVEARRTMLALLKRYRYSSNYYTEDPLIILYYESDTVDGLPFNILYTMDDGWKIHVKE